jgi:hypothetical protein
MEGSGNRYDNRQTLGYEGLPRRSHDHEYRRGTVHAFRLLTAAARGDSPFGRPLRLPSQQQADQAGEQRGDEQPGPESEPVLGRHGRHHRLDRQMGTPQSEGNDSAADRRDPRCASGPRGDGGRELLQRQLGLRRLCWVCALRRGRQHVPLAAASRQATVDPRFPLRAGCHSCGR